MKRVLVTGPPSSGTRWLTRFLGAAGAEAVHFSQPDQEKLIADEGILAADQIDQPDEHAAWFDMEMALEVFDAVVIMVRGRNAHDGSYAVHWLGMTPEKAESWRQESFARLAPAFGNPKCTVVTYESLRERDEREALLVHLGLDADAVDVEPWTEDENAKHYGRTFRWFDKRLPYFDHPYNSARLNERTVEVACAIDFIRRQEPSGRGLEVGNVLSHYGVEGHRVVDLNEVAPGIENIDVLDIEGRYDWIVAISTLEHVRWDDPSDRYEFGAAEALTHLHDLLLPGGKMFVTVPTGYHFQLDSAIVARSLGASRDCTFSRSEGNVNIWTQDSRPRAQPYGGRTPWANTVWVGEFEVPT